LDFVSLVQFFGYFDHFSLDLLFLMGLWTHSCPFAFVRIEENWLTVRQSQSNNFLFEYYLLGHDFYITLLYIFCIYNTKTKSIIHLTAIRFLLLSYFLSSTQSSPKTDCSTLIKEHWITRCIDLCYKKVYLLLVRGRSDR
jgi:hypothetical protein